MMSVRLTALLLLVTTPVAAQTTKATAAADPNRQVCRREASTGSIMPGKRTCHSAAEWKQIDEAHEKEMDSFRNRPSDRTGAN